jgi:hypothetical protein
MELNNGSTVIAGRIFSLNPGDEHMTYILCHYPISKDPFVTWMFNAYDNGCHWGHYFDNMEDALIDFFDRGNGMELNDIGLKCFTANDRYYIGNSQLWCYKSADAMNLVKWVQKRQLKSA